MIYFPPQKIMAIWLFCVAGMVVCMAVIGAVTRLTESGLSMVEWRPLIGAIPPLTDGEWARIFALYQQSPEYQKLHFWMELSDFKKIFFWEWLHRFWGRLIGLAYAGPLLVFWVRGWVAPSLRLPLVAILLLGAGQAVMGWYMVQSGLVDNPAVSHYRLAAHLGLAVVIFLALLHVGLLHVELATGRVKNISNTISKKAPDFLFVASLCLVGTTIIWGAFTAGLDAGLIYNEWPLMRHGAEAQFLPPEDFAASAVISDPPWVQFVHRWLGFASLILVGLYGWRRRSVLVGGAIMLQFGLGLGTLLSVVWLPLAAAHQFGAFMVMLALIYVHHKAGDKTPHSR